MGKNADKAVTQWDKYLVEIEREYREHPDDFLRQPTISRCLHPASIGWVRHYWNEIKGDQFFMCEVVPNIVDGAVGNPYRTSGEFGGLSPASITQVYVLYLMHKHWGLYAPDNDIQHILCVGGGYGSACKIYRELGYAGRYVIADFPLMLHIQRKFLADNKITNVEFELLNMPNLLPDSRSLLIATNSVSEMPLETRQEIEPHYKSFDYLFFSHNDYFDGIDNMEYFSGLKERLEKLFHVDWIEDSGRNKRFNCSNWFMLCRKK